MTQEHTIIDTDLRRAYETDGVVCLRRAFDPHWLGVAADAIEQGRANPGPMYIDYSAETKPGTYCTDFWIWQHVPAMRAFIFESPAAGFAGEIMDVSAVMLVTDNWLVREAGAVNRAPWHHDGPYFDLDGKWCVLWMALEPVGPGEGIVFLKGSHKWGRLFMPESFAGTGPKAEVREPYERTPDFAQQPGHCGPGRVRPGTGRLRGIRCSDRPWRSRRQTAKTQQPAPHHALCGRRRHLSTPGLLDP